MCGVAFSPSQPSSRPSSQHQSGISFPAFAMFEFLTPFACDAIDREAYVPRYIDEASSSPPVRPMSVSEGRRSQSSSHVPIRPDQLREMIGEVVRESLQQAGVGNVPEPANINPPQYSAY